MFTIYRSSVYAGFTKKDSLYYSGALFKVQVSLYIYIYIDACFFNLLYYLHNRSRRGRNCMVVWIYN